jgi:alkanesulfonate monooxygenase SsuD/methylene tetrahydromethanopterin reductase-like flavin-dependent oxidoreductase (luciferase family)
MVQFFYFHLMPWPHLPDDFDRQHVSSWITLSNRYYDPQRGHTLYNEYLDEMERAEALGYDGLGVNEHHQNAYGTMPSPNLMAAALIRRTQRAKIAILGNAIPWVHVGKVARSGVAYLACVVAAAHFVFSDREI